MILESGNIAHIFFNENDLSKKLTYFFVKEYKWIYGGNEYPLLNKKDFPILLICDENKTMLISIIKKFKQHYFSNSEFVKLYKTEKQKYRKRKIENLLKIKSVN